MKSIKVKIDYELDEQTIYLRDIDVEMIRMALELATGYKKYKVIEICEGLEIKNKTENKENGRL